MSPGQYRCDFCGQFYSTRAEALECCGDEFEPVASTEGMHDE